MERCRIRKMEQGQAHSKGLVQAYMGLACSMELACMELACSMELACMELACMGLACNKELAYMGLACNKELELHKEQVHSKEQARCIRCRNHRHS